MRRTLDKCDRKLARHRAALEAGADPALVAAWSRDVQAQRVTAQAQLASISTKPGAGRRMTRDEIRGLVDAFGGLLRVLRDADPGDKLEVYRQLGLRLTYSHDNHTVLAEARPPPSSMCAVFVSEERVEPIAYVSGLSADFPWRASGERQGRPLDQADNHGMRGSSCRDRRHVLIPARAAPG